MYEIARAALGGHPPPDDATGCEFMEPDDMGDAMAAFMREVAERLSTIPGRITDNVKVQAMLQQHLDEVAAGVAVAIEASVALYKP